MRGVDDEETSLLELCTLAQVKMTISKPALLFYIHSEVPYLPSIPYPLVPAAPPTPSRRIASPFILAAFPAIDSSASHNDDIAISGGRSAISVTDSGWWNGDERGKVAAMDGREIVDGNL